MKPIQMLQRMVAAVLGIVTGVTVMSVPAFAQRVNAELFISGLSRPVAFVQDPSQPHVQFVAEQGGRIRPVVDGQLQTDDFLDLGDMISHDKEGGLLGLAFAPDYASSGRLFVNFTNPGGHTVVARFTRAPGASMRADVNSRFDLVWPDGRAFITHPFCCHHGGDLKFGPDGYLYVGLGDGGASDDPEHAAQNPQSLLGKMLRINVTVPDDDERGYRIPDDNPFVDVEGVLPEIWAAGLRNPWRYAFDSPERGGTGALIISDVGEHRWEEFNYEPRAAGGRNYGWRNREGGHAHIDTPPAWFEPLVDPTYEYGHAGGRSIIGGYVYRGSALDSGLVGRYFFGDFVSGQLWSIGLDIDARTGEAAAGDLIDHTADSTREALSRLAGFGEDADGELYVLNWSNGTVHRLVAGPPAPLAAANTILIALDSPASGGVTQPFTIAGWALDRSAEADTGIDYVEAWAIRRDATAAPTSLGRAAVVQRPDVAQAFGPQFDPAGFQLIPRALKSGSYEIVVYAHSSVSHAFAAAASAIVEVNSGGRIAIDQPATSLTTAYDVTVSGWALDTRAAISSGVDVIHAWAFPSGGGDPLWVGTPAYGMLRRDVGSIFGPQFVNVGFSLRLTGLPPGSYRVMLYAHSVVDGSFTGQGVDITIVAPVSDPRMAVDEPLSGSTQPGPFVIAGWAVDRGAPNGTGVDAVHVWAFPIDAGAPVFVGAAGYGSPRPDVGNVFGSSFVPSGFALEAPGLPSGRYQVGIYAHSGVTNTFNQVRFVYVIVP